MDGRTRSVFKHCVVITLVGGLPLKMDSPSAWSIDSGRPPTRSDGGYIQPYPFHHRFAFLLSNEVCLCRGFSLYFSLLHTRKEGRYKNPYLFQPCRVPVYLKQQTLPSVMPDGTCITFRALKVTD